MIRLHPHVLASDGVFGPDGTFASLPPVPEELLREGFRQVLLQFLVKEWAISEELRSRMLEWQHCGEFSVQKLTHHPFLTSPEAAHKEQGRKGRQQFKIE